MLDGINELIPTSTKWPAVHLDAKGEFRAALDCVRNYLRTSRANRVLVGAANAPMALGVLRAFQECGQSATCAVVGQNAETGSPRGTAPACDTIDRNSRLFLG
jgi:hypothetical protein